MVLQVSDALGLINQTLEYAYPVMRIEGEVEGFSVNRNQYVFFSVKDELASLQCFMTVYQLKVPLEDGMRVEIIAQPKLTAWGKFSLTVRDVRPIGEGSIKKASDLLRAKLQKEGLFDVDRKRLLPQLPQRIGVVSSAKAAGYTDFVKILDARWGGLSLQLADVGVQGVSAPDQIVRAIEWFNEQAELVDVLAIVRGGGSSDDLAAFSREDVVRAIAASRIPTVVGVGHEVDTTLSDLVADVRASTPSNAAELLVPDRHEVLAQLAGRRSQVEKDILRLVEAEQLLLSRSKETLQRELDNLLQSLGEQIHYKKQVLNQLSPQAVLKRGYAVVRKDRQVLTGVSDVTIGDDITLTLHEGELSAKVTHVNR